MKKMFFLQTTSLIITGILVFSLFLSVPAVVNADNSMWASGYTPVSSDSYAYSFAIVGSTKTLMAYNPDKLTTVYEWIRNNAKAKNIKFVFSTGDMADTINTSTTAALRTSQMSAKYSTYKAVLGKLDDVVPYSLLRGDSDTVARYKARFTPAEYPSLFDGKYSDSDLLNTYQTFTAGNLKYLVLNLDYQPSKDVLTWADTIVENHTDYNIIVVTHCNLKSDGTFYGEADEQTDLWNNFVSKHKNIVMTISGSDASPSVIVSQNTATNNNLVTSLSVNPEGFDTEELATGMVAMIYLSADGSKVKVEYYSTANDKYPVSQTVYYIDGTVQQVDNTKPFEAEIATVSPLSAIAEKPEISISNLSFTAKIVQNDEPSVIYANLYDGNENLKAVKKCFTENNTAKFDFGSVINTYRVRLFRFNDKTAEISAE